MTGRRSNNLRCEEAEWEARSLYPTRNPSEKKTPQVATHTRKMRTKYRAEWRLSSCSFTSVATMVLLASKAPGESGTPGSLVIFRPSPGFAVGR